MDSRASVANIFHAPTDDAPVFFDCTLSREHERDQLPEWHEPANESEEYWPYGSSGDS